MRLLLDLQAAQNEHRSPRGIGRYSLALAHAIARQAGQHEIFLALSARFPESIEPLQTSFAGLIPSQNMRVLELPGPVAEADLANTWRTQAAELVRENCLADLHPDIVHVFSIFDGIGNEVVASAGRFATEFPTSATIHDVIPLLHPETYLWRPSVKRAFLRHATSLKRADLLLANSNFTRRQAIEVLGITPERIITVGAGVNQRSVESSPDSRAELAARYGLARPFMLYTSSLDPHKNAEGLIAGFALLPTHLRATHQLALTGKLDRDIQARLKEAVRKHALSDEEVVYLGYVPDEDLCLLYATCSVFVFPSFHEGFGLPVVEAMSCGAPVIGSNCTSIPEIIDRQDALFDPHRPQAIAERIAEVLSNPNFRQSLIFWGRERAKIFSWEASARKALDAFEALHWETKPASAVVPLAPVRRRRFLAFVAPLSTGPNGTVIHSAELLPELARYYDITCIVDQGEVADPWITAEFPLRDAGWFEANSGRFERILYEVSNAIAYKYVFLLLQRHPGIVLLRDFHLGSILNRIADSGEALGSFTRALYSSHGFSALKKEREHGRESSIIAFPCNAEVLRTSIGVIASSDQAIELTRAWYGDKAAALIRQIPFTFDGSEERSDLTKTRPLGPIAGRYRDVIEEFYSASSSAREQKLLQAIARISTPSVPRDDDLVKVAAAIAANREPSGPHQMIVDVSMLAQSDARSGIQRVARGIVTALIDDPPQGYRVEPIRALGDRYVYARRFTCQALDLAGDGLNDDPVEAGREDIFVGLDLAIDFVPSRKQWFRTQQQRGMQVIFVAYDLLALLRPELFPTDLPPVVRDWIDTVSEVADGIVCISHTVADELYGWLTQAKPRRLQPLSLGFFHLGADLRASLPTIGLSKDSAEILEKLRSRPSFLMVGTLEPRKGHRQALAAMERLWVEGVNANLVIVGKLGWRIDNLAQRIQQNPERDSRLFWLDAISDQMLEEVYRSCSALLAASEGEGFGLPLIEAAKYGLPIIARDIPVFREVAGEHAYYFRGEDAQALASALRTWLSLGDAVPDSAGIPWLTWKQSSRQLLDVVLSKQWYRFWLP
ncbi:MAG: glycosyltransferase family 4 protein [Verrucomicrobia bacterium]|nr:glycosyltransferase family 4 protein [Verrucomicrobiota bacterium]